MAVFGGLCLSVGPTCHILVDFNEGNRETSPLRMVLAAAHRLDQEKTPLQGAWLGRLQELCEESAFEKRQSRRAGLLCTQLNRSTFWNKEREQLSA